MVIIRWLISENRSIASRVESEVLPSAVVRILQVARQENRNTLLEPEAKEFCRAYGMPTPDFGVARTETEAGKLAEKVTYPVVLKIVSQDILHKSEAGGLTVAARAQVERHSAGAGFVTLLHKTRETPAPGRIVHRLVPRSSLPE